MIASHAFAPKFHVLTYNQAFAYNECFPHACPVIPCLTCKQALACNDCFPRIRSHVPCLTYQQVLAYNDCSPHICSQVPDFDLQPSTCIKWLLPTHFLPMFFWRPATTCIEWLLPTQLLPMSFVFKQLLVYNDCFPRIRFQIPSFEQATTCMQSLLSAHLLRDSLFDMQAATCM